MISSPLSCLQLKTKRAQKHTLSQGWGDAKHVLEGTGQEPCLCAYRASCHRAVRRLSSSSRNPTRPCGPCQHHLSSPRADRAPGLVPCGCQDQSDGLSTVQPRGGSEPAAGSLRNSPEHMGPVREIQSGKHQTIIHVLPGHAARRTESSDRTRLLTPTFTAAQVGVTQASREGRM